MPGQLLRAPGLQPLVLPEPGCDSLRPHAVHLTWKERPARLTRSRSTMRLPATRTCFSAIVLPWLARQQFSVPLPTLFAAVLHVPLIPFAPVVVMRQGIPSQAYSLLQHEVRPIPMPGPDGHRDITRLDHGRSDPIPGPLRSTGGAGAGSPGLPPAN